LSKISENTFSLEIQNITIDHSGEISCKISNEAGQTETTCRVTVSPKSIPSPKVVKSLPESVQVKEWDNLRLEVEIDSEVSQPTKIAWFLNSQELTDDKLNTKISTTKDLSRSILEINRVTSDLSGTITCKISNRSHEVQEETNFQVSYGYVFIN